MAHGTDTGYRHGCRCLPCRAASARARKSLRDDPGPKVAAVMRHVVRLRRRGMSFREIAAAASVTVQTIYRLEKGSRRVVRRSTARRILAVQVPERPAEKVKRQVRELKLRGYSMAALDREAGIGRVEKVVKSRRLSHKTRQRIDSMYRELPAEGLRQEA